jgi:HAD superfamily hydrolase (TIGR01490 family)
MDLALFDFDGTITTRGTYPGFVRFAVPRVRQLVGGIGLSPLIAGYHGRIVSDETIRAAMSRVGFRGDDPHRLRRLGERYAQEVLPSLVRAAARDRIAWHQARGDRVVVVSAALDVYLEPWCHALGLDVVCTTLEIRNGRLTGRYAGGDCCGREKAVRVRERYAPGDYDAIFAYGDTEDDREMLEMADQRWFRWQQVRDIPVASRTTRQVDGGV